MATSKNLLLRLNNKGSIMMKLQALLNDPQIKTVSKVGAIITSAIVPYIQNRNKWTLVNAAFTIAKSVIEEYEIYPYNYFTDSADWTEAFTKDFNALISSHLRQYPYTHVKTSQENLDIRIVDYEDCLVAWTENKNDRTGKANRIYIYKEHVDKFNEKIEQYLWKMFEGKSLVMKRSASTSGYTSFDEDNITFEEDTSYLPLTSLRASEISENMKKYVKGGCTRSIMLYGPPGTGKSTIARTVVENLGFKSFRIKIEDVSYINRSSILQAIKVFKPDAIVLDDFDRTHEQASLLELLEQLHKDIKLVIATVNRRDNLDEALLRPGRFDELILIKSMDQDVVQKVLGEENMDMYQVVKDWPIAFINEYVTRCKYMSRAEAAQSIQELASRVARLRTFDDDEDDIDRVLGEEAEKIYAGDENSDSDGPTGSGEDEIDVANTAKAISRLKSGSGIVFKQNANKYKITRSKFKLLRKKREQFNGD